MTSSSSPSTPGEGTRQRPGGWVDGIGWVARLSDLDPYDIARNPDGRSAQVRIHRSAGVTPDWGYVTVAYWADETEPQPPAPLTRPDTDELRATAHFVCDDIDNGRGDDASDLILAAADWIDAQPAPLTRPDWENLRGQAESLRQQADRSDVPQLTTEAYAAAERLDQLADWIQK